ncbi:MAG: hypothetical protein HY774_03020 [Acidobacteria bacterium]|nr:hypothetical protein [Acidobacteriota bacterium]
MDQPTFQIARTTHARRCEICHQSDCFDPVQEVCSRCSSVVEDTVVHSEGQISKTSRFSLQGFILPKPTTAFRGFLYGVGCAFLLSPFVAYLMTSGLIYCHHRNYEFSILELLSASVIVGSLMALPGGLVGLFWGATFGIMKEYDEE